MQLALLKALNEERAARRAAIVVTALASGAQRLVKAPDAAKDELREALEKRLRSGKSGTEETPEGRFFLTVFVPPPRLVITGAVHISQELAPMAQRLGYRRHSRRSAHGLRNEERFAGIRLLAEWPDKALPSLGIDAHTAFAALTHDPKIDDPALLHAFSKSCFYIGALGSKKTHAARARAAESARRDRCTACAHSCAYRPQHRRGVARRNRGVYSGRDHGTAAAW
jgi:xanthine dehydrogenase accessory factor